MSATDIDGCTHGKAVAGGADFLSLAAAPTFAIMALLTGTLDVGPPDILCSAASPLNGMVVMYVLMSGFHSAPWLKLVSGKSGNGIPGASSQIAGWFAARIARRGRGR